MKRLSEFLEDRMACPDALKWMKGRSLAWGRRHCSRPDWMLWYLYNIFKSGVKFDMKPLRALVKKWKKSPEFSKTFINHSYGMLMSDLDFIVFTHQTLYDLYDPYWRFKLDDGEKICDDIRKAYPIAPDWRG